MIQVTFYPCSPAQSSKDYAPYWSIVQQYEVLKRKIREKYKVHRIPARVYHQLSVANYKIYTTLIKHCWAKYGYAIVRNIDDNMKVNRAVKVDMSSLADKDAKACADLYVNHVLVMNDIDWHIVSKKTSKEKGNALKVKTLLAFYDDMKTHIAQAIKEVSKD